MIYNVNELRKDTVALITQINAQIEEVDKLARERGVPIATIQNQHGDWVMPQLLLAKATAYHTLVVLQSGEKASAQRQRGGPPGRTR